MQIGALRVIHTNENDIELHGLRRPLKFTNWSFGQVCNRLGAPASFLKELPTPLIAENLNCKLEQRADERYKVYSQISGEPHLKAITGNRYSRLEDSEIVPWVGDLVNDRSSGWNVSSLSLNDRSTHINLVNNDLPLKAGKEELNRGLMITNSEVGFACFLVTLYWFRWQCTNGLIFGKKNISEFRIRHIGDETRQRALTNLRQLTSYAMNEDTTEQAEMILMATKKQIASNEKEAMNWLQARGIKSEVAGKAVLLADKEEGQAGTLWALTNGLTAYA